MKRIVTLIIPLLILVTVAFAQTKTVINKANIKFQIKNLGINTGGDINGLQATIQFDPAKLDGSTIDATLDANSVNTDNDLRDKHLRSDEFFDVEKYPKITIKSTSFKHKSGDNYTGQFNLTIKDKTKALEIPFTYTTTGSTAVFKGNFKLNRLDFGVGGKSFVMADDVFVTIEVEAAK
jgi:polyisoprenoid-binding protein YceI